MTRTEFPRRLLDRRCHTSPQARELLSAAQSEGPSPAREAAIRRTVRFTLLGVPTVLASSLARATGVSSATLTKVAQLPLWLKTTAVVALVAGVSGGLAVLFSTPQELPATRVQASPSLATPLSLPEASASSEPVSDSKTIPATSATSASPARTQAPTPTATPAQRPVESDPASSTRPEPGDTQPSTPSIQAELELLRGAKAQLGAGQPAQTLTTIGEYRSRFPGGTLQLEADAIAIEALVASGQPQAALVQVRRFLKRAPNSPQSVRIRALKQRLEREPQTRERP